MENGYALVVGGDDGLADALGAAIDVVRCPDDAIVCPAETGRTCPVRANARVTIVHVPEKVSGPTARRVACVGHSDAPVVCVVDGSDLPPASFGRFAVVGSETGPVGVLAALAGVSEA